MCEATARQFGSPGSLHCEGRGKTLLCIYAAVLSISARMGLDI